jgi:hypothetical protein
VATCVHALTIVRGQKIKENISGVLLALRRIEASKSKREYICTVLAPGRIGPRIELKSGKSCTYW